MGNCAICESRNNVNEQEKTNEQIKLDKPIRTTQINELNGRVNECIFKEPAFEIIDPLVTNISKSICKIKIKTHKGIIFGTGFLLKEYIDQELFYCLMSNEHVISNDIINNNSTIYVNYDSEFKKINIKLDKRKRYIKSFIDIGLDITVVEILNQDNISKDYFLFPDPENEDNRLINNKIYIPQYPKGKKLVYSNGDIKKINKYEFTHSANTDKGASGSPIFLENSVKVMGIHKQGNKELGENYGDFIYPAINIIKKDIRKKRDKGKYENEKYIWEDGRYYIGQFKNNLPYGKGIKYNSNGKIIYEGNFINGKFEGNGKYIWKNGEYYIGQWKNGLRNGKGKLYNANGKIKYEDNWINDKYEGNGKYIWKNGEYYIGQWKNGLRNGKGKMYYEKGKIKYEGDWINGKYEGNGKYFWSNGKYYIGQWKKNLRNGRGTMYYVNGNILYEGDWINDKFEGNGKYIWENHEYYIGQWKNNLRNGKGTMYIANGNILYEGDWIDDKYDGNGKGVWEDGKYYIGQWKNNLRNGKGIMYYSNKRIKYDGYWVNDKYEGKGKYIWENDEYYIGHWKNGFRTGKGAIYYANGKIKYEGNWINGKFVRN